ncbi:lipase 1-like isoform X2 [Leptopilina boulardi]|nr:lipase 1-like isoform X2 [Leptopilina boulardi]
MHGLLMSSADWVVTGPNTSLAFLLVENGYDVWLGNNRGNTFGKNHTKQLETSYGFWDFSWHEFGIYDLPATIDYILKETNMTDLNYICFSQGCTQLLVMGSLKPENNKKIRFTAALAPAAYFKYTKGLNALLHNMILLSRNFVENFGYFEIFPALSIIRVLIKYLCGIGNPWQNLCYIFMFSFVGSGIDEMDRQKITDILTYFPAGSSLKQIIHYHTGMMNGEFSLYDYGAVKNLLLYNTTVPPKYPIENIKVPIAIFYGVNDFLSSPGDVLYLSSKLPKVIGKFVVRERKLNHLDFIYGKNVRQLVYGQLLKILNNFRKN